ncbi:hypothetical protein ACHAXA_008286 [Cyclostephanos tholiformis]|uniref:Uncharacterized protein n=1 Tax=Cyclostephanos tholiformis TaxID=382380 RepID=A0ABD3R9N7_9STRA
MIQSNASQEISQPSRRQIPGILRLLPEALPFYPYRRTDDGRARRPHIHRRKRKKHLDRGDADDDHNGGEDESSTGGGYIPNSPLMQPGALVGDNSFTLFFFVDSTNRHSLYAIPKASHWFRHALRGDDGNRVICVPNQPSPSDVDYPRDDDEDPTIRAAVDGISAENDRRHACPMLLNAGFYYLPFLHPQRLPLIHLLGATRVPSIVVVCNIGGRIVTRHGWEAIARELGCLDDWIKRDYIRNEKCDGEDGGGSSGRCYESDVVSHWRNGDSGLPLYWHLLSWIL